MQIKIADTFKFKDWQSPLRFFIKIQAIKLIF